MDSKIAPTAAANLPPRDMPSTPEPLPTDPAGAAPEPVIVQVAPASARPETVALDDDVWLWALSCSTCGGLAGWPGARDEG